MRQGISASRIHRIKGLADREPLMQNNPGDPRNRRTSILMTGSSHRDDFFKIIGRPGPSPVISRSNGCNGFARLPELQDITAHVI